jgi:tetratricopeptide (TPR) repeat protein
MGTFWFEVGCYALARQCLEDGIALFRHVQEPFGEGVLTGELGHVLHHAGHPSLAHRCFERVLQISDEIGTEIFKETALDGLGALYLDMGDSRRAAGYYEQALELAFRYAEPRLALSVRAGLARVALGQADISSARAHGAELLAYFDSGGVLGYCSMPFRPYLVCYQVLEADGSPRAEKILRHTYDLLMERASRIEDDEIRRSYLESVPCNREILKLAARQFPEAENETPRRQ